MAAPERFSAQALRQFATSLLQQAGLDADKADSVAATLVDGDLLGHDTHGLALLAPYVKELEKGTMTRTGEPEVLSERAAALALGWSPPAGTVAGASGYRCLDPQGA
ncbi:LDH2 family malate/lactate/ureidoglycolate dehydrogenase [Herbaspirillum rubrisubalbicans]|nr:LDH2 family malate/lactate/ureidoglycolate dehydrogenase [Herbaspirillum rubrisubalbicans]